ncbi:kinase-like domain-containing protein [Mucidula mucida]|nr:kinase-like domain-containing protein [Mucidula mucida]
MPALDPLRARNEDPYEMFWVDHYDYFLQHGYLLRPRYQPDWAPARLQPENKQQARWAIILGGFEDELTSYQACLLDATRYGDGRKVVIKRAKKPDYAMLRHLNNPELSSDPKNHAIPLLDSFPIPNDDHIFVILPFMQVFCRPQFHCRKEFAEACRQIFEGLAFMHEKNIAHGDACTANFLMDCTEVYPQGYHWAKPHTTDGLRTTVPHVLRCQVATPVRYYITDFEGALSFPEGKQHALAKGSFCQIKTSPEWHSRAPYNPFLLDVYNVGATFLALCECNDSDDCDHLLGVEDFQPLFLSMTATNPSDRPTMAQCLDSLESFIASKDADWLDGLLTKHESLQLRDKLVEREGLWVKFSKLIPFC